MGLLGILLVQMMMVIGTPMPGKLTPAHASAEQNKGAHHNTRLPKGFADLVQRSQLGVNFRFEGF